MLLPFLFSGAKLRKKYNVHKSVEEKANLLFKKIQIYFVLFTLISNFVAKIYKQHKNETIITSYLHGLFVCDDLC